MKALAILVLLIYGIIFVLEILNAFYEAMLRGQIATRRMRSDNILATALGFLRAGVVLVMSTARVSALWFHELAHAGMSLFAGGMPRIVMCEGGGFAQPRPWPIPGGGMILTFGMTFWMGFVSLAHLIFGSAAILGAIYGLTPLGDGAQTSAWLDAMSAATPAEFAGVLWSGAKLLLTSIVAAKAWQMAVIFLLALAIADAITPSSVDFIIARWPLPAYGGAVLLSAFLLDRSPWLLIGVGVGLWLFWLFVLMQRFQQAYQDMGFPHFFATLGSSCIVLGVLGLTSVLGTEPTAGLKTGASFSVLLLLTSATTYLFFLGFMLAWSLLVLSLRPILAGLRGVPAALRSVFTPIAICKERSMMFQDTCDGCGQTRQEFESGGCGAG